MMNFIKGCFPLIVSDCGKISYYLKWTRYSHKNSNTVGLVTWLDSKFHSNKDTVGFPLEAGNTLPISTSLFPGVTLLYSLSIKITSWNYYSS